MLKDTDGLMYENLLDLRKDLEDLKEFVILNLTAVRKILKKYDRWNPLQPVSPDMLAEGRLAHDGSSEESSVTSGSSPPLPSPAQSGPSTPLRPGTTAIAHDSTDAVFDPSSASYHYAGRLKACVMTDMELLKETIAETDSFLIRLSSFSPIRHKVRGISPPLQDARRGADEDSFASSLPACLPAFDPHPAIAPYVTALDLDSLPAGRQSLLRLSLIESSLSEHVSIPIMIIKGALPGGVVGITSAVHGNELNGIPLIHRLFREIDCSKLCGTLIAVPVVNVHGYVRHQRGFSDNVDLNRIMPGKLDGSASQRFAYQLGVKLLCKFDYHIDLHTASFGRVNSLYVRCDMNHEISRAMAMLQNPQIIVHSTSPGILISRVFLYHDITSYVN